MAGSEATRITTLDWVVVAAGVLAYASAFLPWYTLTASVPILGISQSTNVNAWNAGFGAWFSVLLLVVAAGVVLASTVGGRLRRPTSRSLITLALSALAFITIVLRWATFPDASGGLSRIGELGDVQLGAFNLGNAFQVASGASIGLYLGLGAAVGALAASSLTFRAAAREWHSVP
ncbi:MAG TPA: hypothetical protein VJ757_02010 [Pseudonocardiaceae bacterium]|nr:hypothetical protein [Pseudonocardiaceae bacterium]